MLVMHRAWVMRTVSTRYRAYRTALRFGSTRRRASEPVGSLWAQFHSLPGGSGEMVMFITAAATVTNAATRPAGRVRGPGTLRGPKLNGYWGPAIPSCVPGRRLCRDIKEGKTIIFQIFFFFNDFFLLFFIYKVFFAKTSAHH